MLYGRLGKRNYAFPSGPDNDDETRGTAATVFRRMGRAAALVMFLGPTGRVTTRVPRS